MEQKHKDLVELCDEVERLREWRRQAAVLLKEARGRIYHPAVACQPECECLHCRIHRMTA